MCHIHRPVNCDMLHPPMQQTPSYLTVCTAALYTVLRPAPAAVLTRPLPLMPVVLHLQVGKIAAAAAGPKWRFKAKVLLLPQFVAAEMGRAAAMSCVRNYQCLFAELPGHAQPTQMRARCCAGHTAAAADFVCIPVHSCSLNFVLPPHTAPRLPTSVVQSSEA